MNLKSILGIVLLAGFINLPFYFPTENFILQIVIKLPFWICLFTFMDWKDWVSRDTKQERKTQ